MSVSTATATATTEYIGICYIAVNGSLSVWHHPTGWPIPPPCGPQPNTSYHPADELGISVASIKQYNSLMDTMFAYEYTPREPRGSRQSTACVSLENITTEWKRIVRQWIARKRRMVALVAWERDGLEDT
jgi:hypothetical protein